MRPPKVGLCLCRAQFRVKDTDTARACAVYPSRIRTWPTLAARVYPVPTHRDNDTPGPDVFLNRGGLQLCAYC